MSTLEDQVEVLRASCNGYMFIATLMKESGHTASSEAYLRSESDSFRKLLELEEMLYGLENYSIAA